MDLGRPIPADEAATMPIGQNDAPAPVVATPAQAGHVDSPDVPRPIPVAQLPTDASTETHHVQDHSTHPPHRPSSISEPPTSGVTVAPTHAAPVRPTQQAPTSTIDPNIPSSESAPTALPTNPATEPGEQKEALKDEPRTVIKREVEKTKAAEREIKGEKPKGTIIHGLEDDRLYAMLRRFDTQVTHVLHPAHALPKNEPDLRVSVLPNLPSHSEILKSNLERVFAAVGPATMMGTREVQRLMSWAPEERWRTGSYCAAYFICWIFGYTLVGCFSFFIALICFPDCRRYLFPPVPPPPFTPPSATDPTNQKGDESLLGVVDSKAAHRSKAEQAEEQAFEATSILQAFTTRLIFDGKKKGKEAGNDTVGEKRRDSSSSSSDDEDATVKTRPTEDGAQGLESADIVVGDEKIHADKDMSPKEKKKFMQKEAKRKRDEMVSKMTKMTETGLGAFADFMERMTNALSPPSPYPDRYARFKIAGAFLVPPMILFTFVPAWIFGRAATFGFGVALWGQPLLIRATKEFVERVPNWQELLDMRNSILSGVPTDQQLTLHLLRVAEAIRNPLPRPPPPPLAGTPKEAIKDTTPAAVTAEDDEEVEEAEKEGGVHEAAVKTKHKTKAAITGLFQKTGKKLAGFRGDVVVDGARKQVRYRYRFANILADGLATSEKIGSKVDKLLFQGFSKDDGSIDHYPAKLDGHHGYIVIEPANDDLVQPHVAFVPNSGKSEEFVLPIDDIVEIKKSHVSMTRIGLAWASGADVEGLGLTLRFKDAAQQIAELAGADRVEGRTLHFTRVQRREQLFVRLVSMGRQRWEVL